MDSNGWCDMYVSVAVYCFFDVQKNVSLSTSVFLRRLLLASVAPPNVVSVQSQNANSAQKAQVAPSSSSLFPSLLFVIPSPPFHHSPLSTTHSHAHIYKLISVFFLFSNFISTLLHFIRPSLGEFRPHTRTFILTRLDRPWLIPPHNNVSLRQKSLLISTTHRLKATCYKDCSTWQPSRTHQLTDQSVEMTTFTISTKEVKIT